MEIRNGKVSRLVKSATADSYGKWSFNLEFDNGDRGYYNTKNGEQTYFISGEVSDYLIEAKTSKSGSTYYVITHPEEKAVAPTGGGGRPQVNPKVQMIGFAMSYTKDLIVGNKVPIDDLEKRFNQIYTLMAGKL